MAAALAKAIIDQIERTADKIDGPAPNRQSRVGRINACRAVGGSSWTSLGEINDKDRAVAEIDGSPVNAALVPNAEWDAMKGSLRMTCFGALARWNGLHSRNARSIATLQRAHVIAGEIRYVGKETDRKWEKGDEISVLEFAAVEYRQKGRVVASADVKSAIQNIGINKCARESGFDRKNFVRKLVRDLPLKRNSYNEFVRWLQEYKSQK